MIPLIKHPLDIPNLLCFWDFQEADNQPFIAQGLHAYALKSMNGTIARSNEGVFGTQSIYLARGQWFSIPRAECPALNIYGRHAQLTVIGWVKRMTQPETYDCETIAGVWDESRKKRQYCLFLDLPIWDSGDQVGGHVSFDGAPTPNYKYCMDAAIGQTIVPFDAWQCVAFTYDGEYACAYLNGVLDERAGRNPFHYPHGLFDGGDDGADFTIGAVSRSGEAGNFFHGMIGGIAVYDRALTDEEILGLARFTVQR